MTLWEKEGERGVEYFIDVQPKLEALKPNESIGQYTLLAAINFRCISTKYSQAKSVMQRNLTISLVNKTTCEAVLKVRCAMQSCQLLIDSISINKTKMSNEFYQNLIANNDNCWIEV